MTRSIRILFAIASLFTLAACSSGVSNSGAGGAGTNCGGVDLVCTASFGVDEPSIDVLEEQEEEDETVLISPGTDFGTLSIVINDPLGRFSNVFQGATFTRYDITYSSGQSGAPKLGPRQFFDTLTFNLTNGTGSGDVQLPVADQRIKKQFRDQSSGSTVFPYVVTVRASGRDIATNTPITVVANASIEIGNFVD